MEEEKMTDEKSIEIYESAESDRKLAPLYDLMERTNKEDPDPEDLALLRRVLYGAPVLSSIAGDLAKKARKAIISDLTTSACTRESTQAYVKHIRNQLGHKSAPMLEKLLIEQVVISWLRLYGTEISYSAIRSAGRLTLSQADYDERRLSAAQRRFLQACTTLARIRKMGGRRPSELTNRVGTACPEIGLSDQIETRASFRSGAILLGLGTQRLHWCPSRSWTRVWEAGFFLVE